MLLVPTRLHFSHPISSSLSTLLFHSTSQLPWKWIPLHLLSTQPQVLLTRSPWALITATLSSLVSSPPHAILAIYLYLILLIAHSLLVTTQQSCSPAFKNFHNLSPFLPSAQKSSPRCSHLGHFAHVNCFTRNSILFPLLSDAYLMKS